MITTVMPDLHFSGLDLNLLRVFDALLEEGGVTRAGRRLGLTQSAVSHALNRLRFSLKDELFVRTSEGMRPTPRAAEIGPKVRQALADLQRALAPSTFTAEETTRLFSVAASAYVGLTLLPGVLARFRREAPNAGFVVRPLGPGVAELLDNGRVDVVIGGFGRLPERFAGEPLLQERMVWVLRADHPQAREPLTLETLAALPHLILATSEEPSGEGQVFEHGLERRVIWDNSQALLNALGSDAPRHPMVTVHDAQTAIAIAIETDLAALVPRRTALAYADRVKVFDPPYPTSPGELTAVWRRDHGAQPAVAWLRAILREEAAKI